MKKIIFILVATVFFSGCLQTRRARSLTENLDFDPNQTTNDIYPNQASDDDDIGTGSNIISASFIKDQFSSLYEYGRKDEQKYFTPNKVNIVADGKKFRMFIGKDSAGIRPMFVVKARNNTSCENKYKAYIRKILTFKSATYFNVTGDPVTGGSYIDYIGSAPSNVSIVGNSDTFYGSENVILGALPTTGTGYPDPLQKIEFTANTPQNMVCIDNLIASSKHGAAARTYKNEVPVFFIELELAE
jgi:hypothetical protein